ncbi:hypothetical protein CEP21_02905 (plasmid) [Bacillus anthracis]|nr:hypothetical protein [Bacillus anthracis]TYC45489.1 hypothetical protein CEP21_02905 [Bacillus anthracis]
MILLFSLIVLINIPIIIIVYLFLFMTPTGTPVILLDYAVLLGLIIIVNIIIVQLFLALKTLNFKAFLYGLLVGLLQTIGLYMFLDNSVKLGLLFIIISIIAAVVLLILELKKCYSL